MIHKCHIPIRSFHCDSFGHVNNARYLELLEDARYRFGDETGLNTVLAESHIGFVIYDIRIRFRSPVTEGQILTVETRLKDLGSSSGVLGQSGRTDDSGKTSLIADLGFILVDRQNDNQPLEITGPLRTILESAV